jgi:hypothetical protein
MTHIELIELMYKNRKLLDDIYRNRENAPSEELEKSRLITKVGESFELSESYRNFVDVTLKRINYGIVFHTYSAELQELLKYQTRYDLEQKESYLEDILELIKSIFLKLDKRDQEIRTLLVKIENETSLELDLLIEKSMDILEKIKEVNRANSEVREVLFSDKIYLLDKSIKVLVDEINPQMLNFIENISIGLDRLKQFIARTRKLRQQNKRLMQLAMDILHEQDEYLEETLLLNPKSYYLTLYRSQRNGVKTYPDGSESSKVIRKLNQHLQSVTLKKEQRQFTITKPKEEPLALVNMDIIEADLNKEGSKDIFLSIYNHEELKRFMQESYSETSLKEESFKIFLQLVVPHNNHVKLTKAYNNHEVRIAQWI